MLEVLSAVLPGTLNHHSGRGETGDFVGEVVKETVCVVVAVVVIFAYTR